MTRIKLDEGDKGESLAVEYLRKNGYNILDRNFRIRGGEIDIIAIDPSASSGPDGILVFVEVKTRTSNQFGTPLESITPWKLKALIRTAQIYKAAHRNLPDAMRIDAVTVMLSFDNEPKIKHMENISV